MNSINNRIIWPGGKDFAFTVFDDTDLSTLKNVREIYSLLTHAGFRTTKSVWPVQGYNIPRIGGSTCEEQDYLEWVLDLKNRGFEVALHNVTFHSALREDTIRGIERFNEFFGHYPSSLANHADCQESIYWGNSRLTGVNKYIYNLLTKNRRNGIFRGHVKGDEHYWGDICKEKIKYVRNFVFSDINTLKACPVMPYHDQDRPLVNYWFASSEGSNVNSFNDRIKEENQDRLEEEGGVCIMYTHFGNGFYENGNVNSRFKFLINRLSKKNGWFVPVSILLDYLLEIKGHHNVTDRERKRLERKWLLHKIKVGTT